MSRLIDYILLVLVCVCFGLAIHQGAACASEVDKPASISVPSGSLLSDFGVVKLTEVGPLGWSKTDHALASGLLAATLMDWAQTRQIAGNTLDVHETNKILGPHPTIGKVNTYFVSAIALGAIGLNLLPDTGYARTGTLIGLTAMEVFVVGRNFHLGLHGVF